MDSYSIYIPQISTFYTEKAVIDMMERFHIGLVNRVDFVNINPGPRFAENQQDEFVSAYVHFHFPYILRDKRYEWYCSEMCNNEFWDVVENNQPYCLQVNRHEHWVCMKNNYPIPRTRMNIHQVVENCRQLEAVVMAQRDHIYRLEQLVLTHDKTLQSLVANMLKTQQTSLRKEDQQSITDSASLITDDSDDEAEDSWLHARKLERKCCLNMHHQYM